VLFSTHIMDYLHSTHEQPALDDPWLVSPETPLGNVEPIGAAYGATPSDFIAF
jgi:hypothetical protein